MSELTEYQKVLSEAVSVRHEWLENSELPKLREDLRNFQTSFSSLYSNFLKKGLINEDPYKQETKVKDIHVPDTEAFPETEKVEKMSIRLSNFDNQLDFLVNFCQLTIDSLNIDRIKRILGLIKYIDWVHLTLDSSSINTRLTAELTNQVKVGLDSLSLSLINESTTGLIKSTGMIIGHLKIFTDFQKEVYKLSIRTAITTLLPEGETPNQAQIKKKFATAMPGKPFYPELVDEIIREDYSKNSAELRAITLRTLKVPEKKPRAEKVEIPLKSYLIDGIQSLGAVANILIDIRAKLDENELLLENKKRSFWEKLKRLFGQMLNKEPEDIIYEIEYMDTTKGIPVRERVNFNNLRADIDKRIKNLSQVGASKGATAAKLEVLQEPQLLGFLERNIRDLQSLHRILSALDDYFKANVDKEDRERVKGIKPELSTIKNSFIKANQKRADYDSQKEEAEQFKNLGIVVSGS